jgi:hypothetical protein
LALRNIYSDLLPFFSVYVGLVFELKATPPVHFALIIFGDEVS